MLSYISAKEAAEKWNISQRRVAILCTEKRIDGAMMVGNMWIIPSKAEKPIDKRTVRYKKEKNKKYIVTIEEMVSEDFLVEAKDVGEAMEIAEKNYRSGKFLLESGNLVAKQMCVCDENYNDCTEWVEF